MNQRHELISLIATNNNFRRICKSLTDSYPDDLFQEVCEQILIMPEEKLPTEKYLNFWFYCVAKNKMGRLGQFGRLVNREVVTDFQSIDIDLIDEEATDTELETCEDVMLTLSEFENRVALLYAKHGNMKKVQRETEISYSALRYVKDKINSLR